MQHPEASPITISSYSGNFPVSAEDEVKRSHITHTIKHLLDASGYDLVFIDGPEGMGKTTVLKQFCEENYELSFSCFLNPFNVLSNSEYSIIDDLYNQIFWFLNGTERNSNNIVGIQDLRVVSLELKRKRNRLRKNVYFIIDGLESNSNPELVKWAFDILPINESGFKFIITGNAKHYNRHYQFLNKINHQDYIISPFSYEETDKYLKLRAIRELDAQSVKSLFSASSNGIPGKLANLKRHFMKSNKSVDDLLDNIESASEIFELEWDKLRELNNSILNEVVAIISIDVKLIKCGDLADILEVQESELKEQINRFGSIFINPKNEVQFYSSAQKKFFHKKFESQSERIINKIIIFYTTKRSQSVDSLIDLPNYYESNKDWKGLVELLGGDYLSRVVKASESLVLISQKVNQGFVAAKKLENEQIAKFSMQASLIHNIEGLHTWPSEIEARISLGEYEKAITLAEGALMKEERIRLILKIARVKVKKGLPLDEGLVDLIKKLYAELDLVALGQKAFEIAADLFYTLPQLAIDLLQNSSIKPKLDSLNERLLAKIAISVMENTDHIEEDKLKVLTQNQRVQSLPHSLGKIVQKYSAEQCLFEAEKLQDTKSQIFFTKLWVENNAADQSLSIVIEYSISKCQELSSWEVLDPAVLISLSSPLHNVVDKELRKILIGKFRSFDHDVRKTFQTRDMVRHELNLLRAEIEIDSNLAIGGFTSLKDSIFSIKQLITRADCLALIYDFIMDTHIYIKRNHHFLFEQILSSLKNTMNEIIKVTAEHYDNLKFALGVLVKNAPQIAFEFCSKVPTLHRREYLALHLIHLYVRDEKTNPDADLLSKFYKSFGTKQNRDFALFLIFYAFAEYENLSKQRISSLLKYLQDLKSIDSTVARSKVIVLCMKIVKKDSEHTTLYENLAKKLKSDWSQKISSEMDQLEVGFLLADDLSEFDPQLAQEFLTSCDNIKKSLWIDSSSTYQLFIYLIYFMIKTFSGLIKTQKFAPEQQKKILGLIQKLPSNSAKISLYGFLAHQFYKKGDLNSCLKLVKERLVPIIDSSVDTNERWSFISQCCVLLFLDNQLLTLKSIDEMDAEYKEQCVVAILDFILTNEIPFEPYGKSEEIQEIEFSKIQNACTLLDKLNTDSILYFNLKLIVKIISKGKGYTKTQRIDIFNHLTRLTDTKLPAPNGVPHLAYKIVCSAELIRLCDRDKHELQFESLLKQVDDISNASDRSYTYALLGEISGYLNVNNAIKSQLTKKAFDLLDNLNCDSEFVAGIIKVSSAITEFSKTFSSLCKEKIKSGFKLALADENEGHLERERRLLDIAFKVDKAFAKVLYTMADEDTGRLTSQHRKKLKEHMDTLETHASINSDNKIAIQDDDGRILANACWRSLGDLNANLIVTKKHATLSYLFDTAHKLPLSRSFPIYSYYIQNLVNRLEQTDNAVTFIAPIFDSLYLLSVTLETLSDKQRRREAQSPEMPITFPDDHKIIRIGERDVALQYIKEWLTEHLDDYIKICDPYFCIGDLSLIKTILEINPDVRVEVLTSLQPFKGEDSMNNMDALWIDQWRLICSQDPPHTKINVVVTRSDNNTPLHDRCLITKDRGLKLGTSFNAIGIGKESSFSQMSHKEKQDLESEVIDEYLNFKILTYKNDKLRYYTILMN